MRGKNVVLSLSGGLDSSTLLGYLIHQGMKPYCVSFTYGSKHNKYENKAAKDVANFYDVSLIELDLSVVFGNFKSDLLLNGGNIPEGHYTDKTMGATVVPSRNIIFLSILSGLAWTVGAPYIAIGIHAGDHAIYPDCSTEFYKAMDSALYLGTDKKVQMIAPFVNIDKKEVVRTGYSLGVPFQLTRTCYKDQEIACGKCGSCVERLESFEGIGVIDPIIYEIERKSVL